MSKLGIEPFNRSPMTQPFGLIEKCGIGMCGHEMLKLKNPLIASITLFTMFFALFSGVSIADLIPSHTDVAVFLIPFQVLIAVEEILAQRFERKDMIAFHVLVMNSLNCSLLFHS